MEAQERLEWGQGDQDFLFQQPSGKCQLAPDKEDMQRHNKEMLRINNHNKQQKVIKGTNHNKDHNLLLRILMKLLNDGQKLTQKQ
jgi:hypothetical protein